MSKKATHNSDSPRTHNGEHGPQQRPYSTVSTKNSPIESQNRPFDKDEAQSVQDLGNEQSQEIRPYGVWRRGPNVQTKPVPHHYTLRQPNIS